MSRRLFIHAISAPQVPPEDFIREASAAGFSGVSLFFEGDPQRFTLVNDNNLEAVQIALRDCRMSLRSAEAYPVHSQSKLTEWKTSLRRAAYAGAKSASVQLLEDAAKNNRKFLTEMAEYLQVLGMRLSLEFMPLTPGCPDLASALSIIEDINHPEICLTLDPLHIARAGVDAEALADIPASLLAGFQLCDSDSRDIGNDYWAEAILSRKLPGSGVLPLQDMLAALPDACQREIEVPGAVVGTNAQQRGEALRRLHASAMALS